MEPAETETTDRKRIRVLQVLEATTAGTGKHLLSLLAGLDREAFDVEVACPLVRADWAERGDDQFVTKVHELGVTLHPLDMRRGVNPLVDSRGLWHLHRLIRRGNYDVIHGHSSKAGFLARIAGKWNRLPTVYTPNGLYFLNPRRKLGRNVFKRLEQVAGWMTSSMIAVSESEQQAIVDSKTMRADRVAMIPNAIDCDVAPVKAADRVAMRRELGIENAIAVGTAARFSRQKDPSTLLRALAAVRESEPEVVLVWCGDGEQRQETEALAAELGCTDNIRFLGFRQDAMAVLAACDIFALSSIYEGLPYVLLEAMLLELPVVATNVIGNRDIVVDGKTGLLVPAGEPARFGAALLELVRDQARREQLGKLGAAHVRERFALADMVRATEEIYRSLARAVH